MRGNRADGSDANATSMVAVPPSLSDTEGGSVVRLMSPSATATVTVLVVNPAPLSVSVTVSSDESESSAEVISSSW